MLSAPVSFVAQHCIHLVWFGKGRGKMKKIECILTLEIVWEMHDSEIQK